MKKWYLSKTLWLNGLAGLATVIQMITGTAWLDTELQLAIIVIVNAGLRLITDTGLEK